MNFCTRIQTISTGLTNSKPYLYAASHQPKLMPRKPLHKSAFERAREAITSRDILLFLIAFRILNALSIKTFFQPDEYFQSLEPAWEMAFGVDSGAWITWVSASPLPFPLPNLLYWRDKNMQITWLTYRSSGVEEPASILDSSCTLR